MACGYVFQCGIFTQRRCSMRHALLVGLTSSLLTAGCTPLYTSPQEVRASNPSVTYKYHNDQELLTVNQTAAVYCNQYGSSSRAATFATEQDGKVVVFECVPTTTLATLSPRYDPNLTYSYQTDMELLTASQNAQAYCTSTGAGQALSNIVASPAGTRMVTFHCSPL